MKKKYFFVLMALSCLTLFIGFSCGKSSNSYSNPGGGGGGSSPDITMYNMTFSPSSKTVVKGTVVKWTNNDSYSHTVTSNDGTSFNSGTITAGSSYSYNATIAGTYNYHCNIHGLAMSGTLIVTP